MSSTKLNKATLQELHDRVAFLGPHGLLTFDVPEQKGRLELGHRIALLDKKAHRELGFGTSAWEAVIQLLVNAITVGVIGGHVDKGSELLNEAVKTFDFYRNLTARNRVFYVTGTLVSVVALISLAALVADALEPEINARKVVFASLFAGLGTVASVLSRLTRIAELKVEHSPVNLLLSGASRPIVATILAIVVSLVLDLHLVTFHIGDDAAANERLYLVASFLCGFSERWAKEILGTILPLDRGARDE